MNQIKPFFLQWFCVCSKVVIINTGIVMDLDPRSSLNSSVSQLFMHAMTLKGEYVNNFEIIIFLYRDINHLSKIGEDNKQ